MFPSPNPICFSVTSKAGRGYAAHERPSRPADLSCSPERPALSESFVLYDPDDRSCFPAANPFRRVHFNYRAFLRNALENIRPLRVATGAVPGSQQPTFTRSRLHRVAKKSARNEMLVWATTSH